MNRSTKAATFAGPFPSGDTPIYIDAVARLGRSAGFIGSVGQDDFGRCLLNRFARDGVDFSPTRASASTQTSGPKCLTASRKMG